ncbi:hypothetical protein [Kitasatospora sp. NPDC085879]|jgi:hypothetical protein|uniref:hypothetical protein n=1 Tax=Kitasatospora sp. NPDC085879 TaxID=3154769 RepID=UPI000BB10AC1|nr:hypothetical protein [Streptomyces sp. TLI_235]PBC78284.1 hypothetical protein BX265_3047 [Streptomyces sp. TLI_235]
MNKPNRLLAGLALSGAAFATVLGASPAQAAEPGLDQVADISHPGGLLGATAFTATGLLTGVQPKIPDPQSFVEQAKQQKAEQDAKAAQGH